MQSCKFFLPLLTLLLLTACTKEEAFQPDTLRNNVLHSDAAAVGTAGASAHTTGLVLANPTGDEVIIVPGASSKLHRGKNGITANLKTEGLIPGNAYTMWIVVFNDAPGPPSVTYGAGHVVGKSGKGNFSGRLNVGDGFDHPAALTEFTTPLTAEVHLTIRSHGPAQPGLIPEQIHTIDGGCTSGFPSGPVLRPDSDIVGYCANIQTAIHPAP